MENIILKINGMHCTGCSQRLEKVLKNTDGVASAIVNFEKREATLSFDSDKVTLNQIYDIIADVGFEVEK